MSVGEFSVLLTLQKASSGLNAAVGSTLVINCIAV